jgi:hypothetical protein
MTKYRMKQLKTSFREHGLLNTQLKRNEVVALYGVGGEYTDKILHWYVAKIYHRRHRPDKKDRTIEWESLPTPEQFSRDLSLSFVNEEFALQYFDKLTAILNNRKRPAKVVTGLGENMKVAA